jgi:hypothetical protein
MPDRELEKEPPTDDFDQSSSTRPEEEDVEKASLRRHLTAASASGAAPVAEATYKNDAADGDPNAVGWEGPDDPASPLNWPQGRKWANIGALSVMTILT